jgi:rSAM/selenodomain-associated transferase 2
VISFIIPALDESESLPRMLGALGALLEPADEIVVVDGGSRDGTREVASRFGKVIDSPRGRARQMNAGARAARGELLVFAHADTTFSKEAIRELRAVASDERAHWGFFPVLLDAEGLRYRTIELGIRIRVALGGCATGDQAIFVRRSTFLALGGYKDVPLMEDVELTRLLCRYFEPARPRAAVTTSARRWSRRGVAKTQLRMWALRLAWRLGVPHEVLAGHYPVVR